MPHCSVLLTGASFFSILSFVAFRIDCHQISVQLDLERVDVALVVVYCLLLVVVDVVVVVVAVVVVVVVDVVVAVVVACLLCVC